MTSTNNGRLGDLESLLRPARQIRADPLLGEGTPPTRVISARDLAKAVDLPEVAGMVPVLVEAPESLPWAVAIAATLMSDELPGLVPDRFDAERRLDHGRWAEVTSVAIACAAQLRPYAQMPERLIDEVRDPALQAMLGFLRKTGAADRLVLLDGLVPAAAALALERAAPGQTAHAWPLHHGTTELEDRVWAALDRTPILAIHADLHHGELGDLAVTTIMTAANLADTDD